MIFMFLKGNSREEVIEVEALDGMDVLGSVPDAWWNVTTQEQASQLTKVILQILFHWNFH